MSDVVSISGDASEFSHFAATCDAARATASKLAKTAALAEYLRRLDKTNVAIAARFFAAQPFAPSSGRSLGAGGALVIAAVRDIAAIDRSALHQAFREHGEIGEAISPFWPQPPQGAATLSLGDIQSVFFALAATGVQETKRQILQKLLGRATNREAVYLLKIILGDMRTGVSEGIVEAAIAEAFDAKVAAVRGARLLVGDLDAVAELAFEHALNRAQFRPFVPLGFMLAQPIMTTKEILGTLAQRPAIAEDKFDGIRAQLHAARSEGNRAMRVELFSRGSGSVAQSFPDITAPAAKFAERTGHAFVLDGEIVPLRLSASGQHVTLPFSTLQKRLGRKQLTAKQLQQYPCAFIAFDCLYLDGELLLERPLSERREKLTALLQTAMPDGNETHEQTILPLVVSESHVITTAEASKQRLRRRGGGGMRALS